MNVSRWFNNVCGFLSVSLAAFPCMHFSSIQRAPICPFLLFFQMQHLPGVRQTLANVPFLKTPIYPASNHWPLTLATVLETSVPGQMMLSWDNSRGLLWPPPLFCCHSSAVAMWSQKRGGLSSVGLYIISLCLSQSSETCIMRMNCITRQGEGSTVIETL